MNIAYLMKQRNLYILLLILATGLSCLHIPVDVTTDLEPGRIELVAFQAPENMYSLWRFSSEFTTEYRYSISDSYTFFESFTGILPSSLKSDLGEILQKIIIDPYPRIDTDFLLPGRLVGIGSNALTVKFNGSNEMDSSILDFLNENSSADYFLIGLISFPGYSERIGNSFFESRFTLILSNRSGEIVFSRNYENQFKFSGPKGRSQQVAEKFLEVFERNQEDIIQDLQYLHSIHRGVTND